MSDGLVSIPREILDRWLPLLKDTELRLLLIVARQTVGRGGKQADWLSHSQLKARTGRASEAVSAAVEALIRQELLVATDAQGAPLPGAEDRRRYRGRVFYRLGPLATGKPKTTENRINTRPFRKTDLAVSTPTPEQIRRIAVEKNKIRERLREMTTYL